MSGVIIYEVRPRKDRRGFELISDALPFGRLWYDNAEAAASYAEFYSRSKYIQIRFIDAEGQLLETREHIGMFHEA
jgi:hypothetical protein